MLNKFIHIGVLQMKKSISLLSILTVIMFVLIIAGCQGQIIPKVDESVSANIPTSASIPDSEKPSRAVETITETVNSAQMQIIEMSSSGFSPKELTIKTGDTVKFTNVGTQNYWPASAFHPMHTVYPGSSITKCNTAEASTIFDACRAYGPGETYSFVFTEIGSWKYHDHRNPSASGTIIVK